MNQQLSDHGRYLLELTAWLFAGVAAVSLANAALTVTILAGIASLILAIFRIYDRLRYGPSK